MKKLVKQILKEAIDSDWEWASDVKDIKPLRFREVSYYEVDYYEVERLISDLYDIEYSIPASLECGNDTKHSVNVSNGVDDEEEVEKFLKGEDVEWEPMVDQIMSYMAKEGYIPTGDYLIDVSW